MSLQEDFFKKGNKLDIKFIDFIIIILNFEIIVKTITAFYNVTRSTFLKSFPNRTIKAQAQATKEQAALDKVQRSVVQKIPNALTLILKKFS